MPAFAGIHWVFAHSAGGGWNWVGAAGDVGLGGVDGIGVLCIDGGCNVVVGIDIDADDMAVGLVHINDGVRVGVDSVILRIDIGRVDAGVGTDGVALGFRGICRLGTGSAPSSFLEDSSLSLFPPSLLCPLSFAGVRWVFVHGAGGCWDEVGAAAAGLDGVGGIASA
ncbi:hypothetical protein BDR05DRAFT_996008 [Suillus weaverae]|nr:hypothetical protein BDR05DRAFT_996008 [Suillus weaverae]